MTIPTCIATWDDDIEDEAERPVRAACKGPGEIPLGAVVTLSRLAIVPNILLCRNELESTTRCGFRSESRMRTINTLMNPVNRRLIDTNASSGKQLKAKRNETKEGQAHLSAGRRSAL